MAEVKKDDKKDEKKGPLHAVLIWIGGAAAIAVAIWFFMIFIPIPAGGILDGVAQFFRTFGIGLGNIGESFKVVASGIKNFFSGLGKVALEIVLGTLIFVIIGLIVADYRKTAKAADAKPAKPESAKAAEPAKT